MPRLETLSKRAAIASTLTITALQLALHPDTTPALQAGGAAAFVAGWVGARSGIQSVWLLVAPLAPALMLLLTGRQGPIIEIVWMAGLTGSLVAAAPWSRWALPPWSRLLLGGWALTLAIAWPVFVLREAGFDLAALRDTAAINSWAMLTAPDVIGWTLYTVQVQLVALLWFEWISGVLAAPPGRTPIPVHAMWIGVTLASLVAIVQGTTDLAFLNTEFWIGQQRAAGTMLDANAYGIAAAIAGPVGFLALRGVPRWAAGAGVLVLAVNWSGVWMSSSRTGLVCALFGAAGLVAGVWRAHNPRQRLLALGSAAAAVAVAIVFAGTIGPVQRLTGMTLDRNSLAETWHRDGYGTVSTRMIREYPLLGVGAGAYRYLAPDYWRVEADQQLPLDNAQNWWRHQLAEFGLVGGAFVLAWSGLVAWRVLTARSRAPHTISPWTVRALLVGIGICSLVGMPTQSPVVLLWFFFLVAWLPPVTQPAEGEPPGSWIRPAWAIALIASVLYTAGHLVLAAGPLDVTARAQRFRREHVAGAYAPEQSADEVVFRWTDEQSTFVLPARTPWLVVRVWAHHPDIRDNPVHVSIDSPCGTAFEHDLPSKAPVAVGLTLPPSAETVSATVRVSRTWTPADHGSADTRRLGVGVVTDFLPNEVMARSQDYTVAWPACPAG